LPLLKFQPSYIGDIYPLMTARCDETETTSDLYKVRIEHP